MFTRSLSLLLAALVFAPVAASAAPSKHSREASAGPTLIVRGDQVTTRGVAEVVNKAWRATGGRIEVEPFSTISGIDNALKGAVDIAASARPAYSKRAQEAGLTFTPVAWNAVVLITNRSNPVDSLTLKQIQDIYTGRITNWSQVGGNHEPIDLIGVATPLDGTQFSLRTLLFGDGDHWVAVPRLFINIDSLQEQVSLDDKALGASMLSYADDKKGIKMIRVESVEPSLATLANGSYPLAAPIYMASRNDSPHAEEIAQFMTFLSGDTAGRLLREHDMLPYADATVLNAKSEQQRIDAVSQRIASETSSGGTPLSAPRATYSHLASVAPGSERTVQARVAMEKRDAASSDRYTVVKGDTLSEIAQKYSVSVDSLRDWNHLDGNMLTVGQVLRVSDAQ